ncbi:glycosyltransferase family 2 protein [Chlorobaculum sp. MV4-Y]|jgi:glycosyltransferase involved in cell wall biosynthesis|uniref:glycosyltransferase family 2 protein n=1 Tax=Chlorobaculum sp. MV4-Y TaxID=2976335 RepID=UPI0021AEB549|nr:glycosyltransferase family A protein [Chlorobaculum sp. MV4-Y]UWX58359.1 glycosyltransferase family 2 protein [Chlorobaculum sp. MV4-Y]
MQTPHFDIRPAISVILPTFDRAPLLAEAIGSVVAQSFTEWELIVVDDGSSDETFEIVNGYLNQHANIRYMKHRNRKAALSRNAGIQAAFGRYATFLDSDDLYLPEHLESRFHLLESMPETSLLSGGFVCEGDPWVRDRNNPEKLIHVRECIAGATMFGRRELFLDIGGFRALDYAEDTDLWERASEQHRVLKIDQPESYIYRRSPGSITRTYKPAKP